MQTRNLDVRKDGKTDVTPVSYFDGLQNSQVICALERVSQLRTSDLQVTDKYRRHGKLCFSDSRMIGRILADDQLNF